MAFPIISLDSYPKLKAFVAMLVEVNAHTDKISALRYEISNLSKDLIDAHFTLSDGPASYLKAKFSGTLLHLAIYQCQFDAVKLLLEKGADPNQLETSQLAPALIYAFQCLMTYRTNDHIVKNKVEKLKLIIDTLITHQHTDINQIELIGGQTALHLACYADEHIQFTKALLAHGAKMSGDKMGVTPLHLATQENMRKTVEVLLEAKNHEGETICNVNKKRLNGTSALNIALHLKFFEIAKLLIEHSADTNNIICNKDVFGRTFSSTPLFSAAAEGNLEALKLLIDNGADVNFINEVGCTPLREACWTGRLDVVKFLISVGAEIKLPSGYDLIYFATLSDNKELVTYLSEVSHSTSLEEQKSEAEKIKSSNEYKTKNQILKMDDIEAQKYIYKYLKIKKNLPQHNSISVDIPEIFIKFLLVNLFDKLHRMQLIEDGFEALIILLNPPYSIDNENLLIERIYLDYTSYLRSQVDVSEGFNKLNKMIEKMGLLLSLIKNNNNFVYSQNNFFIHGMILNSLPALNINSIDDIKVLDDYQMLLDDIYITFCNHSSKLDCLRLLSCMLKILYQKLKLTPANGDYDVFSKIEELFKKLFALYPEASSQEEYAKLYAKNYINFREGRTWSLADCEKAILNISVYETSTKDYTTFSKDKDKLKKKRSRLLNKAPVSSFGITPVPVVGTEILAAPLPIDQGASSVSISTEKAVETTDHVSYESEQKLERAFIKVFKHQLGEFNKTLIDTTKNKTSRKMCFTEEEVYQRFTTVIKNKDFIKPLEYKSAPFGTFWAVFDLETDDIAYADLKKKFDSSFIIGNNTSSGFSYNSDLGYRLKLGNKDLRAYSIEYYVKQEDTLKGTSFPILLKFDSSKGHQGIIQRRKIHLLFDKNGACKGEEPDVASPNIPAQQPVVATKKIYQ